MSREDLPPEGSQEETTSLTGAGRAFVVAAVVTLAVHLGLTFYFEPAELLFDEAPNAWLDFDTHIEQTWRVVDALDGWGKSWAYDVQLLAGYPNGTIFDADNKGWELMTFALWKLGLPRGTAFNMFILLAHLLVPFAVYFSARMFGLTRWTALIATWMGMALWFFDTYPRWCWWVGMTAYGLAGYFFLLPLAALRRYLAGGGWPFLALLAVLLSAAHLIHPYSFVILVFPMLVFYGRAFRRLRPIEHAGILGAAAFVLLTNAYWLTVAIRFWDYILDSAFYAQSTISFLFTDYLGMLQEPLVTGVLASRTGFRFLLLAAAIPVLVSWRRRGDDRFWPFAVGIGVMLLVSYVGGYNLVFSQIQPYRHVLPAMYLTVIPAALFVERVLTSGALRKLPPLAYATFGLGLLVVTQNLARDATYFIPELLPRPGFTPEDEVALQGTNEDVADITDPHMELRHEETFEDFGDVVDWLARNDAGEGRVLVEWWILGEHLSWRSDSQILGGFLERNLEHSAANIFRRWYEREVSEEEARQYLEDYAVKYVIFSRPEVPLEDYTKLLKPLGYIPPIHRIYESRVPVSFFAEGSGEVKASLNRLEVTGTNPQEDIVLRYHYLETLVCGEGCQVIKEPLEKDPVGFIRVPAPHPRDFVIENGY